MTLHGLALQYSMKTKRHSIRHSITFDLPERMKMRLAMAAADDLMSVSAYLRRLLAKTLKTTGRKG